MVGLSCPKMKPNQMFQNRKNSQFFPKISFCPKIFFAKKGITVGCGKVGADIVSAGY